MTLEWDFIKAILIIFYLVIFVLASRFLLTLPIMVIYKTTTREAMKKSAFLMKKNWRKVIGFFVPLGILAIVIMAINVGGSAPIATNLGYIPWEICLNNGYY